MGSVSITKEEKDAILKNLEIDIDRVGQLQLDIFNSEIPDDDLIIRLNQCRPPTRFLIIDRALHSRPFDFARLIKIGKAIGLTNRSFYLILDPFILTKSIESGALVDVNLAEFVDISPYDLSLLFFAPECPVDNPDTLKRVISKLNLPHTLDEYQNDEWSLLKISRKMDFGTSFEYGIWTNDKSLYEKNLEFYESSKFQCVGMRMVKGATSPLACAMLRGSIEAAKFILINHICKWDKQATYAALGSGNPEFVRWAEENDSDLSQSFTALVTFYQNDLMDQYFGIYPEDTTRLLTSLQVCAAAVEANNLLALKLLIEHGVELCGDTKQLMRQCVMEQNLEAMELMVRQHASLEGGDDAGWTHLHYATMYKLEDSIRFLLAKGCSHCNCTKSYNTAIKFLQPDSELFQLLLRFGFTQPR